MNRILLAILISALASVTIAAKEATITRDTTLYEQPFRDASTVAELDADTAVTIKTRKGGWYQIISPKGEGWVSITTLRLKSVARKNNNDDDASIGQLAGSGGLFSTGRGSTSDEAAATGLKGLEEETIQRSTVRRTLTQQLLDQNAVPGNQARVFARDGKLQSRQLGYPDSISLEPEPSPGEVPAAAAPKQQQKDEDWEF